MSPEPQNKPCPFCGENIRVEAIKCRYCGEWLKSPEPVRDSQGAALTNSGPALHNAGPQPPQTAEPPAPTDHSAASVHSPHRPSSSLMAIGLGVLLALVLAGAGAWVMVGRASQRHSAWRVLLTDPTSRNLAAVAAAGSGVYVLDASGLLRLSPAGQLLRAPNVPVSFWFTTDSHGNLYSLSHTPAGTYQFVEYSRAGSVIKSWPIPTSGQFDQPIGVAVDRRGDVYVSSDLSSGGFIRRYSTAGNLLRQWKTRELPEVIAADAGGDIYVFDSHRSRVQKFSPTGMLLNQWGKEGTRLGEFRDVQGGLAVDASGNVYVPDSGNDRIQEFSAAGRLLAHWGTTGTRPGQFKGPVHVAIDQAGNVYVLDIGNNRVQELVASVGSTAYPIPTALPTLTATPIPTVTPTPIATATPAWYPWHIAAENLYGIADNYYNVAASVWSPEASTDSGGYTTLVIHAREGYGGSNQFFSSLAHFELLNDQTGQVVSAVRGGAMDCSGPLESTSLPSGGQNAGCIGWNGVDSGTTYSILWEPGSSPWRTICHVVINSSGDSARLTKP